MALKKKNTTSHSDLYFPVDTLRELVMDSVVYLYYGKEFHAITMRKRVTKANFPELKGFHFINGYLREETDEEYAEYKDFLKRRVKNKQIFKKK